MGIGRSLNSLWLFRLKVAAQHMAVCLVTAIWMTNACAFVSGLIISRVNDL